MEDDAHGDPVVVGEIADQVEEFDLVTQVEIGGRFVQEQDACLLRETAGEPHPLELATGELVDAPGREVLHTGEAQRPVHGGGATGIRATPAAPVGVAAEVDHVPHGESARRRPRLRQEGHAARELAGAEREAVLGRVRSGVDRERAGPRALQPGQRAQQGRLPAAVGAHEGGHLGGPQREGRPVDDIDAAVRHGHAVGGQPVAALGRPDGGHRGAHSRGSALTSSHGH